LAFQLAFVKGSRQFLKFCIGIGNGVYGPKKLSDDPDIFSKFKLFYTEVKAYDAKYKC